MKQAFYSQFGEDRILSSLFSNTKVGICVEVGANDGINDSNTYYFETLGWKCVLVEPNEDLCKQIRASRTALLFECAASNYAGTATLNIAEGSARSHGVSTIQDGIAARKKIESYGFTVRPAKVATRTLDDILTQANVPSNFEFLTIDVEGHEHEVLSGLNFNVWEPQVVIVEDNSYFLDRRVRTLLFSHGYLPFMRTGVNDWYAHHTNTVFLSYSNRIRYYMISIGVRAKRSRALGPVRKLYRLLKSARG